MITNCLSFQYKGLFLNTVPRPLLPPDPTSHQTGSVTAFSNPQLVLSQFLCPASCLSFMALSGQDQPLWSTALSGWPPWPPDPSGSPSPTFFSQICAHFLCERAPWPWPTGLSSFRSHPSRYSVTQPHLMLKSESSKGTVVIHNLLQPLLLVPGSSWRLSAIPRLWGARPLLLAGTAILCAHATEAEQTGTSSLSVP